jgi:putative two-component system response regulator
MIIDKKILSANVLIVDDHIANLKLLEKTFKQAGYEHVITTTDPREVITLYQEHDVDVLLLDIRMPHMDGFEVMKELKLVAKGDYLPILILTAELTSETRDKSLSNGAKDFLTKPFDRVEVLHRTRNIIEVRLLHKQVVKQNRQLEYEVARRTKELEDSRLEIIRRLGVAAEYKDNETGNHVTRMSRSSYLLAKQIGLSEDYSTMILNAAPMHDIGKIGIPDCILLKPGKLDADEWKIMQTHVEIGVEILSDATTPLLEMARRIAASHHEKWNGTGYPLGLEGEDISIEGRICAVTDVFDALTSDRPYKKAWSVEDAMSLIREESGISFDPILVKAFDSILFDVLNIRAQYADS